MDKVHYCERFIELMIDLEVRHMICHFSPYIGCFIWNVQCEMMLSVTTQTSRTLIVCTLEECRATVYLLNHGILIKGNDADIRFCRAHLLLSFTFIANSGQQTILSLSSTRCIVVTAVCKVVQCLKQSFIGVWERLFPAFDIWYKG